MDLVSRTFEVSCVETPDSMEDVLHKSQARWGIWILVALLLPTAVIAVRDALTRPFWNDEVLTAAVVSLATPSAIWDALAHGVDAHPPFFFLVTTLATHLASDEHLAYRLPGLLGFFCVPFCLYSFVERHAGVMGGLIAALISVLSEFQGYAVEARPYGLEMGFLALALLCWQRIETSRWFSVPLGLWLAAAVASHYYATLVIPAFFLAEAVRWYRTREFRYAAWIPLAVCTTPLLIAVPLIRAAHNVYSTHFWASPSLQGLAISYFNLTRLGPVFTPGVILFLFASMLTRMFPVATTNRDPVPRRSAGRVWPEECALAAFLLCLPIVAYLALVLTQGGLVPRYVLPMVLGLAIATGFAVAGSGRTVTATLLAILIINHGYTSLDRALSVFRGQSRSVVENSLSPRLEQMLRSLPSPYPVVISSGADYLPLAYYSGPEVRDRILTLVDPPGAVKAINTDSVDVEELILKRYLPLNVQEFSAFRDTHQHFLLFSSGSLFDWWPGRLSQEGYVVKLRQAQGRYRLYEVELVR